MLFAVTEFALVGLDSAGFTAEEFIDDEPAHAASRQLAAAAAATDHFLFESLSFGSRIA